MTGARLAFFFAAYFFVAGVGVSYWPVWLQHRGVGTVELGTIYMSRQIVTVVSILLVGLIASRLKSVRNLMLVLASAAAVMAASYELAWGFWANLGVTLVWGILWHPILSLGEGISLTVSRQLQLDYSRIRVWGSVSFIVGAVAVGWAVQQWGPPFVLYVMWIGVALAIPATIWLPRPAAAASSLREPASVRTVIWLLRQPVFAVFLLATASTQASHAAISVFGTLHWRSIGISDATISFFWAASIVAEILLFLIGGRLVARLGAAGMIALGSAAGVIRWAAMPYADGVAAFTLLQVMHALTFGATHLGAMAFLQRAMNAPQMPLAQSLYYGLANGLVAALMYQLVGWLYAVLGIGAYFTMSALCAVGLLLAWQLARTWDGSPLARN